MPALYWTAASWGGLIGLSKDNPTTVAEVPLMQALIDRALALDEGLGCRRHPHVPDLLRAGAPGLAAATRPRVPRCTSSARSQLSDGQQAAPYVALAEAVAVPQQDRARFEQLLEQALAVDVDARPQYRLANLIMQRRARWLLVTNRRADCARLNEAD